MSTVLQTFVTPGFSKEDRSSFPYFFAHWFAYQTVALCLKCWKPKYLFHDIEKPFLKLFLPYKKLQKFHRKYHRHHPEYRNPDKIDWEALVIDWECCRYTKINCPLSARETYEHYVEVNKFEPEIMELIKKNVPPVLERLKL